MSPLLIPDLDDTTRAKLSQRAAEHGRSIESEAKAILSQAVRSCGSWTTTNLLREDLARSGREFPDSTALIREDRDR